jgi:transposase-like protein
MPESGCDFFSYNADGELVKPRDCPEIRLGKAESRKLKIEVASGIRLTQMRRKNGVRRSEIRYSESFKMAVVRELEEGEMPFETLRRKYGIKGTATISRWARKYGHGDLGKIIRVEKPKEINERDEMKRRIKALEKALADAHIDLAIERATTRLACERAGIADVADFKKKAGGS